MCVCANTSKQMDEIHLVQRHFWSSLAGTCFLFGVTHSTACNKCHHMQPTVTNDTCTHTRAARSTSPLLSASQPQTVSQRLRPIQNNMIYISPARRCKTRRWIGKFSEILIESLPSTLAAANLFSLSFQLRMFISFSTNPRTFHSFKLRRMKKAKSKKSEMSSISTAHKQ